MFGNCRVWYKKIINTQKLETKQKIFVLFHPASKWNKNYGNLVLYSVFACGFQHKFVLIIQIILTKKYLHVFLGKLLNSDPFNYS
jgi:hypothetical protein